MTTVTITETGVEVVTVGIAGADGQGVPTGGTTGQVLAKASDTNFDTQWITGSGTGTVTSVAMTVPTGLAVTGSPITASGTIAVALDTGYVIPTQATLDSKVEANSSITGATKTKITYDSKGLVTAGGDATTSDISEGSNLYYTNARGISSILTGFAAAAGTVAATDTIIGAIQKIVGNITALVTGVSSVAGKTGAVTLEAGDIASGTFADARIAASNVTQHQASLSIASTQVTGTKTSAYISDFAEATDDRVATLLQAGANITLTYNDAANTLTIASSGGGGGGGLSDGDYGDITVGGSGTAMTIDAGVVTLAKMADVATGTVFYRKTAGTGSPEVQTLATLKTDLGLSGTNTGDQDLSGYLLSATAATTYVPQTTTVNGHALSSNVTVMASDVGLGNVTNNAQTQAAIVPNTAPTAGQILAGNAGGTAYAPVSVSGSGATISLASTGVMTISGIANSALANSAITIAGTSTSLGGSITQDTITGLSATGLVKRTGANTLAIATAGTDYLTPTGNGSGLTSLTAANISAGTAGIDITGNAATVTTINGRISAGTNVTITGTGTAASPYVINSSGGGGGLSDGDYGDITVGGSGTTMTIDNDVVTFAKMQNISTSRLLGRTTASTGDIEELTVGSRLSLASGVLNVQNNLVVNSITADNYGISQKDNGGSHYLTWASGETMTANRSFIIDLNDADRILELTGNATISGTSSGTNTGDQSVFSTIAVSGQSDVVADSTSDTLTLAAGSNITITTNATTDTITISATGGGGSPGGSSGQLQYNNAGAFGGTAAGVYATSGDLFTFTAQAATDKPLIVKGAASQSATLQEWRNTGNTVLGSVDASGFVTVPAGSFGNHSLKLGSASYGFFVHSSGMWLTSAGSYFSFKSNGFYLKSGDQIIWSGNASFPDNANNVGIARNANGELRVTNASTGYGNLIAGALGAYTQSASAVPLVARGAASQTAALQEWQDSSSVALSSIRADGSWQPPSIADSSAANNSLYYSTTAGKLVYKDSGGTVNALY